MENNGYYLPQDIYSERLKKINGISFTRREIDIIAFLIRGRTAKKIAALLSISPKTVENHTRNIMIKLQCNSRESIIDFIEKSGKFSFFKDYYTTLMITMAFEKSLKAIDLLKQEQSPVCFLVYWPDQDLTNSFVHQLEAHLKLAGIAISLEAREKAQPLSHLTQEVHQGVYMIYVLPNRTPDMPQPKLSPKDLETRPPAQEASPSPRKSVFLLPENESSGIPEELEGFDYIDSAEHKNYHFFAFAILRKLFPNLDLDKIIFEFKETSAALDAISDFTHTQVSSEDKKLENQRVDVDAKTGRFLKNKGWLLVSALLILGLLVFGILTYKEKKDQTEESRHHDQRQNQKKQNLPPVRSDLVIPPASTFLNRPQLIAEIADKFSKKHEGIQIIALVGIGGSGKTTLARQYARTQKSSIVWEINLATQESFMESLKNLADVISKTETEKKILKGFQTIKNCKEREEKIILFIKERIKYYPSWFVIYNNLESVSKIQNFFPPNPYGWGNVKILVTTRDSNIQNIDYINSTIQIGELNQTEKFNLFVKIFGNGKMKLSSQQEEKIRDFLQKIPPFPLDISVAATYLKATHIPFKGYLEHLKDCNQSFIDTQENVLKEGGKYAQTRYSVITLSLKKLIDTHKDFGDLLLLISLLDFQDIPRTLLNFYKSDAIVDNFIYNLKKYSLLADNLSSTSQTTPVFSVHQSTQEICLIYLSKILNLQKNNKIFTEISHYLENYVNEIAHQQDFVHMRTLINHCEKFLSHQKYLSDNIIETINGGLGHLYAHLGEDKKAIQILNKSIMSLTKYHHENHSLIPLFLNYLGDIYFDLGDYDKSKNSYEKSLKIYRQYFPKNYGGIADALSGLAIVYRSLGNYKDAKDLLEQSLTLYKRYIPDNHFKISWTLKHLGYSYKELGNYEKAKDLLEQSLVLYKRCYPEGGNEVTTWIQVGLANLYRELGNYQKARELFEQSLIAYKENLPENHHKIARVLKYLGILYREWGDYQGSKDFLEKSLNIYEKHYPEDQNDIAVILKYLGNVYRRLGDYQKSKELLEKSFKIQNNLLVFDNKNSDSIYLFLGNLYVDLGDYEQAKKMLKDCLKVYEDYYGKNHIASARVLRYLGRAYLKEGDMKSAEATLSKSLKPFQQSNHPHTYRVLEDLGTLYQNLSLKEIRSDNKQGFENYNKQALDYMTQALQTAKNHFPEGAPHIIRVQEKQKSIKNKELKEITLE